METSTHFHLKLTPRASIGKGGAALDPSPLQSASPWGGGNVQEAAGGTWSFKLTSSAFSCVRKSRPGVASGVKEGVKAPQSPLPTTCPLVAGPG